MNGVRLLDLTNEVFGDLRVVARAENLSDGTAMWIVQCPHGHQTVRRGGHLRESREDGTKLECRVCVPKPGAPDYPVKRFTGEQRYGAKCSECGSKEHTRSNCDHVIGRKPKWCRVCGGLGHRRPPEGCPGCDRPYVPEPPVTLQYTLMNMRAPTREVI